jgi:hypothetical protein
VCSSDLVHDQLLAMMTGLIPEHHDRLTADFLLPYLRGDAVPGAKPSAFWSYYVLQEAGRRGFGAECLGFIRRHWTPMLETGTTWEDFTWSEDKGGTASHAWTSHPCVHFAQILAGIRQTAPGWTAISVSPTPLPGLDHAEATIPSPRGDIVAGWRREGSQVVLRVSAPKGVRADIRLGGSRKLLAAGGKATLRAEA